MRRLYLVVVVVAAVLLASLTSLLRNAQSCACEQTYMYTSYTEIPVLDPRWAKHRYKLRLYRETAYSRQVLPPDGLPALLIPGNAGSYEQVRSLASETARLAAQARRAAAAAAAANGSSSSSSGNNLVDMDWYSLDFNGELSAFDGYLLSEQTEFALACLKQLRAMYSSGSSAGSSSIDIRQLPYNLRPQLLVGSSSSSSSGSNRTAAAAGIVLVGHSMGGVVARAAATAAGKDPLLGPSSISLLLTLSSPHQYPPLMLQPQLARFYGRDWLAKPLPAGLPAVTIHGGPADMQVSPYLTRLPAVGSSSSSSSSSVLMLSLSSLHIPGVWLAAGHTQIDWCNQLVRRIAAALMEVHAQQQQQQQGGEQQGRTLLLLELMQQRQLMLEQQQQQQQQQEGQGLVDMGVWLEPSAAASAAAAAADGSSNSSSNAATARSMLQSSDGDKHSLHSPNAAVTFAVMKQYLLNPNIHNMQQSTAAPAAAAVQLLLPAVTPLDVLLTTCGGCQDVKPPPEWFITSQAAAAVHVPSQHTTYTLTAAAAAHASSSSSSSSSTDVAGGTVLFWDVPQATAATSALAAGSSTGSTNVPADFVLLVSGAKPCSSFRVWVQQQQQWVDVTAAAIVLPVLQDALVSHIRDPNTWAEVMAGKDYIIHAAWLLTMNHTFLAAHNATRVAVWMAAAAAARNDGSSSSSSKSNVHTTVKYNSTDDDVTLQSLPASATATAQWIGTAAAAAGADGSSKSNVLHRPVMHIGPLAFFKPLYQPSGGAMLLQLQLHWHWIVQGLSIRVSAVRSQEPWTDLAAAGQQQQHVQRSSSNGSCWHPVAMYKSVWGGVDHVSMLNTTSSSGAALLLLQLRQGLHAWLTASIKASSVPGNTASVKNSVLFSDVQYNTHVTLLLDPECSYSISLGWDAIDAAAQLLLTHANAAAGMAAAMLLLVLSHQMSALTRLLTAARQGSAGRSSSSSSKMPTAAAADEASDEDGTDTAASSSSSKPHLRQLSAAVLRRLRDQLDSSLGGAPPAAAAAGPGSKLAAAAAAAAAGPDSQAGVSVLESLAAVSSDIRVLLLAGVLAAAASGLNTLNPNSLGFSSSSSMAAAVGWLLHQGLGLLGLSQRGDSPSVVGAALLLGVGLLLLMTNVWLTVAVKWLLDWCSATVTAFNRSLTPNPETMAAIAATSNGGSSSSMSHQGAAAAAAAACVCSLCTSCCLDRTSSGGLFAGTFLGAAAADGTGSSSSIIHTDATSAAAALLARAPDRDVATAAAAAAPAVVELSTHFGAQPAAAASVGVPQQQQQHTRMRPAAAVPWWQQQRCQLQVALLLLLTVANVALGLGGAVLLLFFTWHLPSNSSTGAAKVAQMLLGSRANSRASSRTNSPVPNAAAVPAAATALPHLAYAYGYQQQQQQPTSRKRVSIPGIARTASGEFQQQQQWQQRALRAHSPIRHGSLLRYGSSVNDYGSSSTAGIAAAAAAAAGAAAAGLPGSHAVQPDGVHDRQAVRSDAGLVGVEDNQEQIYTGMQNVTTNNTLPGVSNINGTVAAALNQCHQSSMVQPVNGAAAWQQQRSENLGQHWQQRSENLELPSSPLKSTRSSHLGPAAAAAAGRLHGSGGSADVSLAAAASVAVHHDAAAARAAALHQLTCHMMHAWTLLYGCCCLMMMPSLIAWAQLPLGQQHMAHWLDVLLVLPVLLHCTAISAGTVEALVGYGPATAAAARRIRKANAGTSSSSSRSSGPIDLYKLVVRSAAVYMFAAALLGQTVVWLGVVAAVAWLMLGGQVAVEAWYKLHAWMHGRSEGDYKHKKQKDR